MSSTVSSSTRPPFRAATASSTGPEVAEIYESGVVLKIDAAEAEQLPPPGANPAAMSVNPADLVAGGRRGALGRAWDKLSGKG